MISYNDFQKLPSNVPQVLNLGLGLFVSWGFWRTFGKSLSLPQRDSGVFKYKTPHKGGPRAQHAGLLEVDGGAFSPDLSVPRKFPSVGGH